MHLLAQVGRVRVGLVHGDAGRNTPWLDEVRRASPVDVFACTHTCLAALRDFALPSGQLTIINNGAAGMPNFSATTFGVVSRIAASPSPHPALYGLQRDGVYIDALALRYDQAAFVSPSLNAGRRDRSRMFPITSAS
jgi:hypothetical protein